MRKELLLIAALIAPPNFANADASNTLNGPQVDPAGVPAPAAAAGFTTPVVQADFTMPGNFWSNTANYITNCGAASSVPNQPATWHFSFNQTYTQNQLPCPADIAIVTDSGVSPSTQALWRQVPVNALSTDDGSLMFPTVWNSSSGLLTAWLPNEYFVIVTARVDCGTWYQHTCAQGPVAGATNGEIAFWNSSSGPAAQNGGKWLDEATWEVNYVSIPTNVVWDGTMEEWPQQSGPSDSIQNVNVDFTQYHTIAVLYTSDESSAVWQCRWVDPNVSYTTGFVGCDHLALQDSSVYREQDRYYLLSTSILPTPSSGGVQSYPMNIWIKSFQMWSCSNVGNGTCPGTMVTHWPFP